MIIRGESGESKVSRTGSQATDTNKRLLELANKVSLAADFQGAMQALLEQLWTLMPCDGISVMWLDGDHLEVIASQGSTAPLRGLSLPVSQVGAARAAMDSGRPVVVADTAEDAGWRSVPGEERAGSWLGAPLRVDSWNVGLLEWTSLEPSRFAEYDAVLAGEVARCVAPILNRAQLLEDARQRLRERMEPAPAPGSETVSLNAELKPVVHEALEFTKARHAYIFVQAQGIRGLRCLAASGEQRLRLQNVTLRGDGTLAGWSVPMAGSSGRLGAGPSDREIMAELGIKRTLNLPLMVDGDQVGMLGVAEPVRRSFGRDAIRLMTQLASQASLILEQVYHQAPQQDQHDYQAVFRSSPLGVGTLTAAGEILLSNPALASLLLHSNQNLAGRLLSEFLVEADGRRLIRALEDVDISGQRRQVDARIQLGPGQERHVRISLSKGYNKPWETGGSLVAIMEDVTALKILEQERIEHLMRLQELDQLKSRFVSNVSHELRTPLAVIKLYATLTRKGRPEKQDFYLQTIEQETHRLETMVENILDLTRMDRQELRVNPELLAAEEIIEQVMQVYKETAQRRGVDLRNHVRGELPLLWADRNHLIQLLTNLVDNALKYTLRGGQVWVAAHVRQANGQLYLEIAVGDTGPGIPEDEQERVFERFYRGSSNSPGSTGTGLGLAIVRELMLQHGGEVTLQSEVGKGSVFALHFPLYDEGIPEEVREQEGDE